MNKLIKGLLSTGILLLLCITSAFAEKETIKNFIVKENSFATDEIAVIAADTAGNINNRIDGVFLFNINGFQTNLRFNQGVAFYNHKIGKSTFIYVKHENEKGTHSTLYYVYRAGSKLVPIHISWFLLFLIPAVIILLGYMFKRFIIIAVVLLAVFVYFNHSNGLSISTFFETVFYGIKHIF